MDHLMDELPGGIGKYVSLPKLLAEAGVDGSKIPAYTKHLALVVATNAYIERGTGTLDDAIRILTSPNCTFPMVFPRQLWQDLTGTPLGTDFAAFQHAVLEAGGSLDNVDLVTPIHCVVDHSGEDGEGNFAGNLFAEISKNRERYGFLKFLAEKFSKFKLVPAGKAICHQANAYHFSRGLMEYAPGVWGPDAVCGLDSHTPTVGAISVVSKGLGGVDALPQAFGKAIPFANSPVVRVKLIGEVSAAVQATDLALIVAEAAANLKWHDSAKGKTVTGIGGCVLELDAPHLDVETVMATANMGPEHQAFTTFRPVSDKTLEFLRSIGHDEDADRYEAYLEAQGLLNADSDAARYAAEVTIDLGDYTEPSVAGTKQPHHRYPASRMPEVALDVIGGSRDAKPAETVHAGCFGVASISSCTASTSMFQMFAAALVAQALNDRGATVPSFVKTSFTPGSESVVTFLTEAGLMEEMEALGFGLTGYGCGTCIGNTGVLHQETAVAMAGGSQIFTATSSNRNFEDRVLKGGAGSFLMNPAMVVVAAVAGSALIDLTSKEGFALDEDDQPILLSDVMPTVEEVLAAMRTVLTPDVYREIDAELFNGTEAWEKLAVPGDAVYPFSDDSHTLIRPTFFQAEPVDVAMEGGRVLAHFYDDQGDEAPVTTDHISPVAAMLEGSPASVFLNEEYGVSELLKYGKLRGAWKLMVRGTFANAKLRNRLMPDGRLGQWALGPDGEVMNLYDAAMQFKEDQTPLVIFGHHLYGSGSSRDWAAKGTQLLGVQALIAEGIATIHRTNLVALGVVPIHMERKSAQLSITGSEAISIQYPDGFGVRARCEVFADGELLTAGEAQIYDPEEARMIEAGGVCPLFLRETLEAQGIQTAA